MKQIDIHRMTDREKKEVLQEARLLEVLQHPNIVKFIDAFPNKEGKLCIIMSYADGGDLKQKIQQQSGGFPESQILDWFAQLCNGVKRIHDENIIHRDLKPANIFLTGAGVV